MNSELTAKTEKSLFIGLDLGQAQDFTAMCIIERHGRNRSDFEYRCRHLQRWKLRTSYPTIVADTVKIVNSPSLQSDTSYPTLAIDATGCGAPVADLFRRERINATLKAIQITGGTDVTYEGDVTRVPKRDLVSSVQLALQNRQLKISDKLPEAVTLVRELENFQVKITDAANDTYGAWRTGTHDDLVLACALALWCAQNDSVGVFF